MQMRTKAMLAATALWLGAALAGAQPADGPGGPPKGSGGFRGDRVARVLDLTEDQRAAFQKLLEEQRPQMEALHKQMRDNHQKLDAALEGANPDSRAVGQIVIQGHALRKQAEAQREQASQALRGLLTPEQQAKFDALRSLREDGGFGPGFGPGPFGRRGPGGPGGRPPLPPQE
jgi:Spy/CpxP family protein refolding chaperone